jgi:hypothetical protein
MEGRSAYFGFREAAAESRLFALAPCMRVVGLMLRGIERGENRPMRNVLTMSLMQRLNTNA